MQTDIYYRDITKSENLEAYLLEKVEGTIEEFFKYDSDAHLTVRVESDRRRTQNRRPSYMCEVILKPSRSRTIIKVQKSDENFKACVAKTVLALKSVLAKRSSKKAGHHRDDPMLQRRNELEETPSNEEAIAI